jgi:hypothetical protein
VVDTFKLVDYVTLPEVTVKVGGDKGSNSTFYLCPVGELLSMATKVISPTYFEKQALRETLTNGEDIDATDKNVVVQD